jgi:hypothetical protein
VRLLWFPYIRGIPLAVVDTNTIRPLHTKYITHIAMGQLLFHVQVLVCAPITTCRVHNPYQTLEYIGQDEIQNRIGIKLINPRELSILPDVSPGLCIDRMYTPSKWRCTEDRRRDKSSETITISRPPLHKSHDVVISPTVPTTPISSTCKCVVAWGFLWIEGSISQSVFR